MFNNRNEALGFTDKPNNPTEKYFGWKSNEKTFSYYDKDKGENVLIKLPFKFLVLAELHTVKGWSDALTGSIIANEVQYIGKEPINAYCYHKDAKGEKKRTLIASGIYKEIKDALVSAGARYHKSIYIMLEDGTVCNLQLKGAGVQKWGDFSNRNKKRLMDEWVLVDGFEDGKKGAVKFTTPLFKLDKSLSEDQNALVNEAFEELKVYLNFYLKTKDVAEIFEDAPEVIDDTDDDLAF
jgi:hypothetical protein